MFKKFSGVEKVNALKKEKNDFIKNTEVDRLKFINLLNSIAKTELGLEWLRSCYVMSEFGSVSGDINPNLLQRKEALRFMYVKCFRQFFNADVFKAVECNNYCASENIDIKEEKNV